MSNIIMQKTGPAQLSPRLVPEEAANMIRELFRWNPLHELGAMRVSTFAPAFEVRETKDRFVFKADVPGVKEQELEITLAGNRLAVSGGREEEKVEETDTYFTAERTYGSFARSFVLPEGIDTEHVQAGVRDGVLTIVIPKAPEMKPRKIQLEGGGKLKA